MPQNSVFKLLDSLLKITLRHSLLKLKELTTLIFVLLAQLFTLRTLRDDLLF